MEKIIHDFLTDLTTTFPEKSHLWQQWQTASSEQTLELTEYFKKKFPERFFDILYQNEDIFKDKTIDTCFLPNVSFSELFTSNISEHTKQAMWKYLQLILFKSVDDLHSKNPFGDTADLFQGVSDVDLQKKMEETLEGLKGFFQPPTSDAKEDNNGKDDKGGFGSGGFGAGGFGAGGFDGFEEMFGGLNSEKLQEHLKKLMGGKIGTLVEELMEELKDEFGDLEKELGSANMGDKANLQDVMKKMMKNPQQLMNLMKKMTEKIKTKMSQGGNQEEFMRETADVFKEMGGREGMMKMFEQMKKSMPGGGKNMKINEQAIVQLERNQKIKDRLREKQRQKQVAAALAATQGATQGVIENAADGKKVFRIPGSQPQEKSALETRAEVDDIMQKMGLEDKKPNNNAKKVQKKKGK